MIGYKSITIIEKIMRYQTLQRDRLKGPFYLIGILMFMVSYQVVSQHSNIRISTGATSRGVWVSGNYNVYRFTPTADDAVLNVIELQTLLEGRSSIELNTARTGGNQAGNIIFESDLSQPNAKSISANKLINIVAGGNVQFNANLTLRQYIYASDYPGYDLTVTAGAGVSILGILDLGGGDNNWAANPGRAGNVNMVIAGDLSISGQVITKGWNNLTRPYILSNAAGYNGGAAGSQSYTVIGSVNLGLNANLNSGGGASIGEVSTTGGNGGAITINSTGSILLRGSINSSGGSGNYGGSGSAISIRSSTSWLDVGSSLNSQGGSNFYKYMTAKSPNGGNISLNGFGGLSIRANIKCLIGTNGFGTNGSLTLTTENTTLTSGGINDGQVAGVLNIGSLIKNGSGNFGIGGTNIILEITYLNAGTLTLLRSESIDDNCALFFYGGTFFTNGFTENVESIYVSQNSTLAFGSGNHSFISRLSSLSSSTGTLTITGWDGTFPGNPNLLNLDNRGILQSSSSRFVSKNGVKRSTGGINQYGQINSVGSSGAAGKFFINTDLSGSDLNLLKFINKADGSFRYAQQLPVTKEIVPGAAR